MNPIVSGILAVVIGYLLGCFSTGLIAGKAFAKLDIRTKGSGNAGATNMLRTLGWVPSLVTVAGDIVKSVLACWIGEMLLGRTGAYLAGVASVIGHDWPVFFGFKGGKGVASSFGVLIMTCPVIAASVFVLEIATIAITKMVSVASIAAAVLNVIMSVFILKGEPVSLICSIVLSCMLVFCHRANIGRLIRGKENKLDFKKINKLKKDGKGL